MANAVMINGSAGTSVTRGSTNYYALANAAPTAQSNRTNADITQRTAGT